MYENELEKLNHLWEVETFNCDFYRKQIQSRKYFRDYESFCQIPFMRKEDIRDTGIFARTTTKAEDIFGFFSSSGSTGEKTYYVFSQEDKKIQETCARKFLSAIGVGSHDIGGVFAPIDTGIMAQTMMWQFSSVGAGYVNCPIPTSENIITLLQRIPVSVVATRPEAMMITDADCWEKLQSSSVRILIPGGGFLTEGRRQYLEKIWNAECYNFYGMSEVFGPLAAECRQKNGQHYPHEYLMIEIVDPETGDPVEDGNAGIAVYTTLWKKGFPLLRYWTDDFVRVEKEKCDCGCDWPRIYYLGRKSDCLKIENHYYFPRGFEELLFSHGITGDYRARYESGKMQVWIEAQTVISYPLKKEIEEYFQHPCEVILVKPGSLKIFQNHKNHFEMG